MHMSSIRTLPAPRILRRRSTALLAASLAAAIMVAGCGVAASPSPSGPADPSVSPGPSTAPSAAPSSSPEPLKPEEIEAVFAEIEEQVASIRGLQQKADVSPTFLDEAALQEYLKRSFAEDNPPDYVASYGRLYKAMGLLGPDDDLGDLYIKLLSSEVLGLYDPDDGRMYVVARSGGVGPVERFTYSHEFDHALQDQHFDSSKILPDALDQGDRSLARLSLLEGDATLLMTEWAQQNLTPSEIQAVIAAAADPEAEAIYQSMPSILRDSLSFPYDAGLLFVLDAYGGGGWTGVDELYADPPDSTEQVIHIDKYKAGEDPIAVTIPADVARAMGSGWKEAFQDTLGEFTLREWLRDSKIATADADAAAAGWGGDRTVFLEGPSDAYAAAIVTEWDSAGEADEFATQAKTAVAGLMGEGAVLSPSLGRVVVLLASDADGLGRIGGALGVAG
jgi:hypothetical protein